MVNIAMLPKAYKEVLEILKYVPKADFEKIPKDIIENMENKKDTEYQYEVTKFKNFNEQEMLKETEAILAVFYRDYWASKEEKMAIRAREQEERRFWENEKSRKYSGKTTLFEKEEIVKIDNVEHALIEVKEDGFWKMIWNGIKNFFKK